MGCLDPTKQISKMKCQGVPKEIVDIECQGFTREILESFYLEDGLTEDGLEFTQCPDKCKVSDHFHLKHQGI